MTTLVVFVLAAAVLILAVLLLRARLKPEPAPPPSDPLRRDSFGMDPRRIKVGDIVRHGARDYVVRGSLDFDEGGFRFQEHLLDDTKQRRWLAVEDDEELELVLYERVQAPELTPGTPRLTHNGIEWTLDDQGEARYVAAGATGTPVNGSVEYIDYRSGDRFLAFERFTSDGWEVSLGQLVSERELEIYPAPSQ